MKRQYLFSIAIILIGGLLGNALRFFEKTPIGTVDFSVIPNNPPGYYGAEQTIADFAYDVLRADATTLRDYVTAEGTRFQLFVAYFGSQKYGSQIHSPKHCLPGGGWRIDDIQPFDLQLPDVEGPLLVRTLRQEHPRLPLVVIPTAGDEAPPELADVDIQGTLPKPFFLPELPGRIQAALSRSAREEAAAGPAPPVEQAPAVAEDVASQVTRTLSHLAQEVTAEAVLLTRAGELLFQVGRLPEEEVVALAAVISESWQTSARVAQILGKEQLRFEQSIEGAQHLLYSLALADELILSVVIEGKAPLGMIRHRVKEAAEAIRELMGA